MDDSFTSILSLDRIFLEVYNLLGGGSEGGLLNVPDSFFIFWSNFRIISYVVSLLFVIGIVYSVIQIRKIRILEAESIGAPKSAPTSVEERKNEKWQNIVDLSSSLNPSDWRLAILEADILLDECVTTMGYKGENLGEKLKSIERSDFNTLEQAWEAHKVRNTIAHTGSDFILTAREARRVIDLYKQVFEEFQYI